MNFQKLVKDLLKVKENPDSNHRISMAYISKNTGMSISAISRLKNGQLDEPKFTPGYKIVQMHAQKVQGE